MGPNDLVWRDGMAQWMPAMTIAGLFPNVAPPVNYYTPPPPGYGPRPDDLGQQAGMRMLLPVGRSGWAIAAGYLGLFSFIILPAPLALIISIIALLDIKKHSGRHGMGRAIFGLIMGILGSLLWVPMMIGMLSHH